MADYLAFEAPDQLDGLCSLPVLPAGLLQSVCKIRQPPQSGESMNIPATCWPHRPEHLSFCGWSNRFYRFHSLPLKSSKTVATQDCNLLIL